MKKKILVGASLLVLVAVLIATVVLVEYGKRNAAKNEDKKETVQTFADYVDSEFFADLPAMVVEKGQVGDILENDTDVQTLNVNGSTLEEYRAYVKLLETNGYKKHSDNGEEGIENHVYTTSFTKEDYTVTVMHMARIDKTYITVAEELPLSDNLIYNEEENGVKETEAQTKLHMPEQIGQGNSYIIQLKNGNFIINDGGIYGDAPYLLDYLDNLTPGDAIPVVEAWIFSHPHPDHTGFLGAIKQNAMLATRVYVEEVYYCSLNATDLATSLTTGVQQEMEMGLMFLRNSAGKKPTLYRPQTGQRYYFDDVTMDIVFTIDLMPFANWSCPDANEASTWLMYTIEGQKFLLAGDADVGQARSVFKIWPSDYFNLKIYSVFHHGLNIYDTITNYMTMDTLLYPALDIDSVAYESGVGTGIEDYRHNSLLKAKAKEAMHYGDGGKILTFPYVVGTAECLPKMELIYGGR